MIYFLQSVDGGPVKIGNTESAYLKKRVYGLELHYGQKFVLLGTMDGDYKREAEIHARFAHLRLGSTEQFQPAPELMEFIGLPVLAHANYASIKAMPVVKSLGTPPTQMRLSDRDKEDLECIRKHFKLGSRTDAVRAAIKTTLERLGNEGQTQEFQAS
jgi:hypothetical protein